MTDNRYIETHTLTLVKNAGRRLAEPGIKTNLDTIIAGSLTGARVSRGWSAEILYRSVEETNEFDTSRVDPLSEDRTFYTVKLVVDSASKDHLEYRADLELKVNTDRQRDSLPSELENLIRTIAARGQYPKWSVEALDGQPYTIKASSMAISSVVTGGSAQLDAADAIGYAPLVVPQNWDAHFKHLYGVEDQIGMCKSALAAATSTGWAKRFHTKLIGPPGCGKSAILRAMKQAVGEEAVMEFDATATTQAGALEMLSEYEELPRVMIVEEIEKAPTDVFQFLLGLMDDRAEIRKVTARKKINRDTRVLVFATANDEEKLDAAMGGALSSRFANPIYFNRPDRSLLRKILEREVELFHGDESWIDPTLDLAEVMQIDDPRRIISMMMLGGNDLITGEYQRRLLTVGMPHKINDPDTEDMVKSRLAKLVADIRDGTV